MSSAPLFDIAPAEWALLRRLLDEAMELPAADRPGWLAALPPEHAALRPRLENLLSHADDETDGTASGGNTTRTSQRFGSMPRLAPIDNQPPPLPPDAGPYRAIRLLGEGGMGRVWLAERTDGLLQGRPVALKLPIASWHHPQLAERMAQEREILAVLDHPHIARIHDAGVTTEGQPFLALEYVEGERIDAYVHRLGLDTRQRIALFLQVTSAVAHAHARLVVHRDLKPGNILVTAQGQVRLLDFGIAKLLAADPAQAELTAPAQRAMTPQYAAPEQILGRPIGTAADIYSLGVVLYELLTGVLPYQPKRASAASLEDTILSTVPARPSQKAADASTRRLLQGDLDTVLLKALKKDPAERYATVQALADDLQRWLDNRPVAAQADSAWYHARKFVQRNRLAVGLAGGFVLSLGAALGVALWQANEARQQAAKATAITGFLVGLFKANDIEQAGGLAKREQSVQQLLEHSADSLATTGLSDQPEVRGELQRVVGGLLHDLEILETAIRVRQARVTSLKERQAPRAQQVLALRELGDSLRENSDWVAARAALDEAHALCDDSALRDSAACLGVTLGLGRVDYAERKVDAALARVEPLVGALQRHPQAGDDLAESYELLALLRMLRNQPDASHEAFKRALQLRQAEWGDGSVRLADMRYRFGRHLWTMRRLAQAEAALRASWQTTSAALGPEHVASARSELWLGRLQTTVGLSDEGMVHLRHARQAMQAQADRLDPSELYQTEAAWAGALLFDGRLSESKVAIDEATAQRQRLGSRAGSDPTLDLTQARWLLDTGHFADSRALLLKLRDTTVTQLGAQHPYVADRLLRLAQVDLAAGDLGAAGAGLTAALATEDSFETVFGTPKHRAQLLQVQLWLEQGHTTEAAALADKLRQLAAATPRAEQYRESFLLLNETVGRALAAAGRAAEASPYFEQFITTLEPANAQHPWLAMVRAHHAASLLSQGLVAEARRQAELAHRALLAQPLAGPQFWRPLKAVEAQLAKAGLS
ncbi:protein kinase [Ideonella sp.]|uniref:serine/threonine-protein kinase n=1 Tax=Ideonella sp. TaxID=1929293 RepID=UPI0035AF11BA